MGEVEGRRHERDRRGRGGKEVRKGSIEGEQGRREGRRVEEGRKGWRRAGEREEAAEANEEKQGGKEE